MAVLFIDSFDHYATADLIYKYNSVSSATIAAFGRTGTNCLRFTAAQSVQRSFSALAEYYVGFALKVSAIPNNVFLVTFFDGATEQCCFVLRPDGFFQAFRGTTNSLGLSSQAILTNAWYFVEFNTIVDNAVGAMNMRINGVSAMSIAGVDTQTTANAYATAIRWQGVVGANTDIDDLYVSSTAYLGDGRCECLFPTGNGATNDWTPSAGANWENVDDTAPDEDATYNASSTPAQIDLYQVGAPVTISGNVSAVQVVSCNRKTDAGARTIRHVVRPAAANFFGANQSIANSYVFYPEIFETNPATGIAWALADVDGEYGIDLVA